MMGYILSALVASALLTACASAAPPAAAPSTSAARLLAAEECRFDQDDGPVFTDPAELVNVQEVSRALQAEFPRSRRDEGGTWTTTAWILIGRDGRPMELKISRSSGDSRMDEAALKVARMMRFSPAENRGEPVCVWISIPLIFRSRGSG